MRDKHSAAVGTAIIGAGAIGVSSALTLLRKGESVTVFDALPPGSGASFGNAGLISVDMCVPFSLPGMLREVPAMLVDQNGPLSVDRAYISKVLPWIHKWIRAGRIDRARQAAASLRTLHQPALARYKELLGPNNFNELIETTGHLQVWEGETPSRSEEITHMLSKEMGVDSQPLSENELREIAPHVSETIKRAVLFPRNGYATNPYRLVQAIARSFQNEGGAIRHERVMRVLPVPEGVRLLSNVSDTTFQKVIVCAGAWSQELLEPLGIRFPMEPERGYHVMLDNPNLDLSFPVLNKSAGFGVTPMEGRLRVAGTVEFAGLQRPPDPRRADSLYRLATKLLPDLSGDLSSIWMGMRPSLPDSLPIIDACGPRAPGLYLACGHGHTGITAAAVTGDLMSDLALGRQPAIDMKPFRLSRFY